MVEVCGVVMLFIPSFQCASSGGGVGYGLCRRVVLFRIGKERLDVVNEG